MATKTKKRRKATTKYKKGGSKRGLGAIGKATAAVKSTLKEIQTPAEIAAGVIGGALLGSFVDKQIEKVKFFKEKPTGIKLKPFVKGAVAAGVGIAAIKMSKGNSTVKNIGTGAIVYGVASTANQIIKKDGQSFLLKGLGEATEYSETAEELARIDAARSFVAELPERTETEQISGNRQGAVNSEMDFSTTDIM